MIVHVLSIPTLFPSQHTPRPLARYAPPPPPTPDLPLRACCFYLKNASEAESLFILVRDVEYFEEFFADSVLAFVKDLGFTGPMKEPQRIVQEGCLPFDPATLEQKVRSTWSGRAYSMYGVSEI